MSIKNELQSYYGGEHKLVCISLFENNLKIPFLRIFGCKLLGSQSLVSVVTAEYS